MSMEQNENGQQEEMMNVEKTFESASENNAQQDDEMDTAQIDNRAKKKDNKKKHKTKKSPKKHTFNRRAFRKDSYSAAMSVVVIAIVVVLNMIVGQIPSKYTEFDISTGKLYTIGDETKKVLKNLDEDITIHYIVRSGNEREIRSLIIAACMSPRSIIPPINLRRPDLMAKGSLQVPLTMCYRMNCRLYIM